MIWGHIALAGVCDFSHYFFFVIKLKFKGLSCEKMHMASILVLYGFRWHSVKPYRTRLRLIRYGLSECHLNPYRTRMDTICISYHPYSNPHGICITWLTGSIRLQVISVWAALERRLCCFVTYSLAAPAPRRVFRCTPRSMCCWTRYHYVNCSYAWQISHHRLTEQE